MSTSLRDDQIKYMVDRFLGWRLPEHFSPDCGISFKANYNERTAYPAKHEPTGTNLFDATQAEAMIRYLVDGMPADGSEQFTIFVDGKPIDVAAIYKAKGFDKLPPSVTLTGGEIRKAYGRTPAYTLARGRYPACVEIADGVAVTLVNGEHFYVLLPASMW